MSAATTTGTNQDHNWPRTFLLDNGRASPSGSGSSESISARSTNTNPSRRSTLEHENEESGNGSGVDTGTSTMSMAADEMTPKASTIGVHGSGSAFGMGSVRPNPLAGEFVPTWNTGAGAVGTGKSTQATTPGSISHISTASASSSSVRGGVGALLSPRNPVQNPFDAIIIDTAANKSSGSSALPSVRRLAEGAQRRSLSFSLGEYERERERERERENALLSPTYDFAPGSGAGSGSTSRASASIRHSFLSSPEDDELEHEHNHHHPHNEHDFDLEEEFEKLRMGHGRRTQSSSTAIRPGVGFGLGAWDPTQAAAAVVSSDDDGDEDILPAAVVQRQLALGSRPRALTTGEGTTFGPPGSGGVGGFGRFAGLSPERERLERLRRERMAGAGAGAGAGVSGGANMGMSVVETMREREHPPTPRRYSTGTFSGWGEDHEPYGQDDVGDAYMREADEGGHGRQGQGHAETVFERELMRRQAQGLHAPATAATVSSDPALYAALVADVDRYFSSDDHRTRARDVLAKQAAANGLGVGPKPPSPTVTHGPLHIVEFKACRTDVFYVAESSGLRFQRGDLVIVEADRGRDLGKVVRADVGLAQVRALKAQQQREQAAALAGAGVVGQQGMGMGMGDEVNVQPKQIYRLAQPAEVAMLLAKSQDEAQAMLVCQAKVRQRKLPMEILDAEYQWDRRKLTFYFATNSIYRVDFRELVRDLFKVYKTRIWMCAVNPYAVENPNVALGAPGAVGQKPSSPTMSGFREFEYENAQMSHYATTAGAGHGRPLSGDYSGTGSYAAQNAAAAYGRGMQSQEGYQGLQGPIYVRQTTQQQNEYEMPAQQYGGGGYNGTAGHAGGMSSGSGDMGYEAVNRRSAPNNGFYGTGGHGQYTAGVGAGSTAASASYGGAFGGGSMW
ncbi:hypothetical protein YB2330_005646 [Saitoella coloradoensis]